MKRKLNAVLNLGQMSKTPADKEGVHFIAKVISFSKRKEIVVMCPDGTDRYTIPLNAKLRNNLKNEFDNSSSGELFILIERKGQFGMEMYKLKDYSDSISWDTNMRYTPSLDSVNVSLSQKSFQVA